MFKKNKSTVFDEVFQCECKAVVPEKEHKSFRLFFIFNEEEKKMRFEAVFMKTKTLFTNRKCGYHISKKIRDMS